MRKSLSWDVLVTPVKPKSLNWGKRTNLNPIADLLFGHNAEKKMDAASHVCVTAWKRLEKPAVVAESTRISQSLSLTLCNLTLLMNWSLQVQTPRTGTNADYNPTLQPPPQASHFFRKDTATSYRGSIFLKETMGLTTRHHSPWRCRTDTPLTPQACVPAQGRRRQFTLEGGLLGTELYLVPPSTFALSSKNQLITLKHLSAKLKTDTKEDTAATHPNRR